VLNPTRKAGSLVKQGAGLLFAHLPAGTDLHGNLRIDVPDRPDLRAVELAGEWGAVDENLVAR
jgi:hypothetical protein